MHLCSVLVPEGGDTGSLARGELVHARVVGVVHVVVDWVDTWEGGASAGVTASWAARGGGLLGWGVWDTVTAGGGSGASTLEGMKETEPVTNLVGGGTAKVVVGGGTTWDGGGEDGASIVVEIVGGWAGLGEVAVSKETSRELLKVDVEGLVVSLAERLLHGELGAVGVPGVVGGKGSTLEDKLDTGIGEISVEDSELDESVSKSCIESKEKSNLPAGRACSVGCFLEPQWFRSGGRGTKCRPGW